MRAIDEGDETLEDFCRGDLSPENVQRILNILTMSIKRGMVCHGDGPPVPSKFMLIYRLTPAGRKKFNQDESLSRHGTKDSETGMSRSAMQIISAAMSTQPASIFNFALFLR